MKNTISRNSPVAAHLFGRAVPGFTRQLTELCRQQDDTIDRKFNSTYRA
jgi:hypothetical protein